MTEAVGDGPVAVPAADPWTALLEGAPTAGLAYRTRVAPRPSRAAVVDDPLWGLKLVLGHYRDLYAELPAELIREGAALREAEVGTIRTDVAAAAADVLQGSLVDLIAAVVCEHMGVAVKQGAESVLATVRDAASTTRWSAYRHAAMAVAGVLVVVAGLSAWGGAEWAGARERERLAGAAAWAATEQGVRVRALAQAGVLAALEQAPAEARELHRFGLLAALVDNRGTRLMVRDVLAHAEAFSGWGPDRWAAVAALDGLPPWDLTALAALNRHEIKAAAGLASGGSLWRLANCQGTDEDGTPWRVRDWTAEDGRPGRICEAGGGQVRWWVWLPDTEPELVD